MDLRAVEFCAGGGMLGAGIGLATGAYRSVCYVEREAYAAAVLAARIADGALDDAPIWTDAATFDGSAWRGSVDLVIGGYPCQPFSVAGKRRGTDDPRHIWPHIARHVESIGPEWCFFENVGGHLRLGYFDVVKPDLERFGYRVEETLIEAQEVGAPHKRERLFIMARRDVGHASDIASRASLADAAGSRRSRRQCRRIRSWPTARARRDDARGSAGQARDQLAPRGEPMADASAQRERRERARGRDVERHALDTGGRPEDANGTQRRGATVGDADNARSQGRDADRERTDERAACRPSSALYPPGAGGPGTADYERWRAILAERPELAPALESPVHVVADGMADLLGIAYAHRRSWLRLTGNGVVPQQVAYAFTILARRFGWDVMA